MERTKWNCDPPDTRICGLVNEPDVMIPALAWFSALSFLGYGISCLFTRHMRREFDRFGLARYRAVVGLTQVLGAAGLLIGIRAPVTGLIASGGLALQMLLGVALPKRRTQTLKIPKATMI
jgi:hypothetical protein